MKREEAKKELNKDEWQDIDLIDINELIDKIYDDFEKQIKELEAICEELVNLPKGVESHSWSDYKRKHNVT